MPPPTEIQSEHGIHATGGLLLEDPQLQGFSFHTVLGALRRHKLLIVTTFMAVMAAVVGLMLVLPSYYTATASIEVEKADTNVLPGTQITRGLPEWIPGDNSIMATQIARLKTPALVTQVVNQLKLTGDHEFRPVISKLEERAAALIQRWLPSRWQALIPLKPDVDPQAHLDAHLDETVRRVMRQLSVVQDGTSHVISVGFASIDPQKAARIANAVANQYLDNQAEAKRTTIEHAYGWIAGELRERSRQLLEAETAAVDYMAAHGLEGSEPTQASSYRADLGGLAAQELTKLQDELVAARSRLAAIHAKVREIDSISARNVGFDSLPEVASSPTIVRLKEKDAQLRVEELQLDATYNMSAPALNPVREQRAIITQQITIETEKIVHNIRDEEAFERDRVAQLELLMSKGRDQYVTSQRASIHLRELTRDASAKRTLYEQLLSRQNEVIQQMALVQPDATIISPAAVPTHAGFPNKLVIGGVGFLGALTLGVVLAGLAEYNDHSLRTAWQVERILGTANLGLVPLLAGRDSPRGQPLHSIIFRQPRSLYAETVRSILLQLMDGMRGQSQVTLVTSALPREGKTTLAMSLAATAANLGRKTVVVDLDLHYPSVARQAGLSVGEDLAKYMNGTADLDQIIYPDPLNSQLHLIPLRDTVRELADLLHTWDLERLIANLRGRYHCVFLDLPPSVAISDIQVVGKIADTGVFVVQWGKTSRSAAMNAIAAMVKVAIPVGGVVLTQVDLAGYALYGYDQFDEYHKKFHAC